MIRWRSWLGLGAVAIAIALVAAGGLCVLGATDGASQWAVEFDTALVQHLPDQVAPLLYRLLGQGEYRDIHARNAERAPIPAASAPPQWCKRPTIPKHGGTLEQASIRSRALNGASRDVFIYLPPSYFEPGSACWRYPVVYLLDGWPGSAADWFTAGHAEETTDRLIARHTIAEVILVSVDGNGGLHQEPQWANAYDGTELDETFLTRDVIGYVDHHFRTWADAEHRAVGGLSDGGFGAANIGLHHPELFSAGMALSGDYLAPARWPFGNAWSYRRLYSPLDYIFDGPVTATARRQFWFLGAGSTDGVFFSQTRALDRAFTHLGIPHVARYWSGGHSWKFWDEMLGQALPEFDKGFTAPPSAYAQPNIAPERWPAPPP